MSSSAIANDGMGKLRSRIAGMVTASNSYEISDGQYTAVLMELFEHLKFAQERIVELERRLDDKDHNEFARMQAGL